MSNFFEEVKEQSLIKATIVSKYFWAWAKVIIATQKRYPHKSSNKIAYIDLFAGPGRYKDGQISTPLRILKRAIEVPDIRNRLVTLFNDKDDEHIKSLEKEIHELPNIQSLKYKPKVYNEEIGEEIVKMFEKMRLIPTLFFVDPWGYKGLSLRLVNSVLKDWGCDCIFFFNYNRINMGLSNPSVAEHMNALFGEERADILRTKLSSLSSYERELAIIEEICQALQEMGGKYVLPFRFKDENGVRTSHHLIFVSKHVRGYEIMKEIMAKESSDNSQGVPTFEYNPVNSEKFPLLFELDRPLDDLGGMLLKEFSGKALKMKEIFENHHIGKRYIKKNYKVILKKLESENKITCNPSASERPKRKGEVTFSDKVLVTFPLISEK
jgi:three-Cys-motif partner protein